MKKIFYWFNIVSRGYSAPMSIINWLVAVVLTLSFYQNANVFYAFVALLGILFAHLGTNLFDDCIDYILKVPKQKCKTEYLDSGFTTIKNVFFVLFFYFLISLSVAIFFYIKFGNPILYLIIPAILCIILYPKLNNYALGELAVGLCFGVLLFAGVCFIMSGIFDVNIILISIPISLLTVAVLVTHSLMDYDFDCLSNKKTLCQLVGSKNNALFLLMSFYALTLILTLFFVYIAVLPIFSLFVFILIPFVIKLYLNLKNYILNQVTDTTIFGVNFSLAQRISLFYNLILIFAFLVKDYI